MDIATMNFRWRFWYCGSIAVDQDRAYCPASGRRFYCRAGLGKYAKTSGGPGFSLAGAFVDRVSSKHHGFLKKKKKRRSHRVPSQAL